MEGTQKLGKAMVPKKMFFTKGVGKHKERLTSFELALRDAGIASQNLVRVSSIFPPRCKVITRKEGAKLLNHGEVVFEALERAFLLTGVESQGAVLGLESGNRFLKRLEIDLVHRPVGEEIGSGADDIAFE